MATENEEEPITASSLARRRWEKSTNTPPAWSLQAGGRGFPSRKDAISDEQLKAIGMSRADWDAAISYHA